MTTQFSWGINALYTIQQPDPNYVVNAVWTLTGVQDQHTASVDGNTQFEVKPSDPNFVPYDQLTEKIVIEWVQASLGEQGVANAEACVQGQIDSKINPPVSPSNTPLPWSASTAV